MPLMIERSDRAPRSANFRRFLNDAIATMQYDALSGQPFSERLRHLDDESPL